MNPNYIVMSVEQYAELLDELGRAHLELGQLYIDWALLIKTLNPIIETATESPSLRAQTWPIVALLHSMGRQDE